MKNKNHKKIIFGALLLTLMGALFFYAVHKEKSPTGDNSGSGETIMYEEATEEEKQQAEQNKQKIVGEQEADKDNEQEQKENKKSVTPVITSAGHYGDQIEVRAFIPGIFENGGTCTITLKQNDVKIVRQVEGIQDATTTRCDTVNILRDEIPNAGTWTARVNYNSPSSQGESDETSFEIK